MIFSICPKFNLPILPCENAQPNFGFERMLMPHFSIIVEHSLIHHFSNTVERILKHHFYNTADHILLPHFSNTVKWMLKPHFSNTVEHPLNPHFSITNKLECMIKHHCLSNIFMEDNISERIDRLSGLSGTFWNLVFHKNVSVFFKANKKPKLDTLDNIDTEKMPISPNRFIALNFISMTLF